MTVDPFVNSLWHFPNAFFDAKKEKMPSSEQGICIVILLDLLVLYLA